MAGITPLTYQILLSLADGDGHGYGIIKEIEQRSGSTSAPSTGALYLVLQRMGGRASSKRLHLDPRMTPVGATTG